MMNEMLFLINTSNAVHGYGYLFVLIINISLYSLFFTITRLYSLYSLRKLRPILSEHKFHFVATLIVKISALIGGWCYLLGSNIQLIFSLNGSDLGCDDNCQHVIGDTSTVLLIIASLLFSINEIHGGKVLIFIRSVFNSVVTGDEDDEWPIWVRLAESIGFIRVFDSAFTTAASLPSNESVIFCDLHEEVIVWVMFILLLLVWAGLLVIIMGPGVILSIREMNTKKAAKDILITLGIWLCTMFLLLGGNFKPLACRFDCDIYSSNFTALCDIEGYHSTRFLIQAISFCLLSMFGICLIARWIKLTKGYGFLTILEVHMEEELNFKEEIVLLEFKPLPQL